MPRPEQEASPARIAGLYSSSGFYVFLPFPVTERQPKMPLCLEIGEVGLRNMAFLLFMPIAEQSCVKAFESNVESVFAREQARSLINYLERIF